MPGCEALVSNEPCANDPTYGWQRWATAEEITFYHNSGDLPKSETTARILVQACDTHKITDVQGTATHDMDCGAPPTCNCSVTGLT